MGEVQELAGIKFGAFLFGGGLWLLWKHPCFYIYTSKKC
jgi:hypothetical protein